MTSNLPFIPAFSGRKADFADWRPHVFEAVANASTTHRFGLRGFILSPAKYARLDTAPFAPFAHPGAPPPTSGTAEGARLFQTHKQADKIWTRQEGDLRYFRNALLGALPDETRLLLTHPNDGETYDVGAIWHILETEFVTLTVADVKIIQGRLTKPFVSGALYATTLPARSVPMPYSLRTAKVLTSSIKSRHSSAASLPAASTSQPSTDGANGTPTWPSRPSPPSPQP